MIKQKTFDLLDAQLRTENEFYNKLDFDKRQVFYTHKTYRVDPWWANQKYNELKDETFNWSIPIKYSELKDFNNIIFSEDIGIYLFIVSPTNLIYNLPQTVLYVGISGDKDSNRPLKDRLNDYYQISKIEKRENIHKIIQLYYDNLYIVYTLYKDGDYKDLLKIETALTEFFSAPYSDAAYEPQTKKSRSTWK